MPQNATMTDTQTLPIGVTILDTDNEPFDTAADLPSGATIAFTSSDDSIATAVVRPDGLNADIQSVKKGTATITVTPTGFSPALAGDTVVVTIKNAAPGSINLTVGAPVDENAAAGGGTPADRAAAAQRRRDQGNPPHGETPAERAARIARGG